MNTGISKRGIVAWCFYEWANSAFPTLVLTFIFATYYTVSVAKTQLIGTAQWADAIALSGLMIAVLSPVLGAIADQRGHRKSWVAVFTLLMSISAAGLWWIYPSHQYAAPMLILVVLGTVGFEVAAVFYNAMLKDLAPADYIGRISGWGWGLGYVGGLCCLLVTLFGFVQPHTAWIAFNHHLAEQVRICGPFIAVWTILFSLPLFIWAPDRRVVIGISQKTSVWSALGMLWKTLRNLPKHPAILLFLIAHMLYIDGLNTLFAFGGIYAAGTFGFTMSQVLLFGIAMNVSAGIGAIAFAWLDDWWGAKQTILTSLFLLVFFGSLVLIVHAVIWFWVLALIVGLFVGPVQAASRSLLARLAPAEIVTELFGLYAFSGKATAFVNPWLVGLLTLYFHSQRMGMASVMVFMFVGALVLIPVKQTD